MCNSCKPEVKSVPHKHAEFIHAWAGGSEIQFRDRCGKWVDINNPNWIDNREYRIKPEPKPDVTHQARVGLADVGSGEQTYFTNYFDKGVGGIVAFKFDGETKKLKGVEMIKENS